MFEPRLVGTRKASIHLTTRHGLLICTRCPRERDCAGSGKDRVRVGAYGRSAGNKSSIRFLRRRMGEPEDVAGAALFLVSSVASWITGEPVAVDGSSVVRPQESSVSYLVRGDHRTSLSRDQLTLDADTAVDFLNTLQSVSPNGRRESPSSGNSPWVRFD